MACFFPDITGSSPQFCKCAASQLFSPSHQPSLTKLLTTVSSALLFWLTVQFCFWQHGSFMHFSLHPEPL